MTPAEVREQAVLWVGTVPGHVLRQQLTAEEIAGIVNEACEELRKALAVMLHIHDSHDLSYPAAEEYRSLIAEVEVAKVGAGETAEVQS